MFDIGLLATPVIGGFIGCITNVLAIRMMFRPYEAVYIGRFRLPFTPGIIPSQRERIAASIGRVVSAELLNSEIFEEALLSEETVASLRSTVLSKINSYKNDGRSIGKLIADNYPQSDINGKMEYLKWHISLMIRDKLLEDGIGSKIADAAAEEIESGIGHSVFGGTFVTKAFSGAILGIKDAISDTIDGFIKDKGVEMIEGELSSAAQECLDIRICDIYAANEDKIPALMEELEKAYRIFIKENMENTLKLINIQRIIEDRIADFSPRELEEMSFSVMKRELNAIVYLGALLGFIIGLANMFFIR